VIAIAAAIVFFLGGSPFLVVLGAGLAGALVLRDPAPAAPPAPGPRIGWSACGPPAAVLAVSALLIVALLALDRRLALLGLLMMKVDIFAFGGAFASVPLMFREVVGVRGWLPANVFLDGIALGQVTPGPIVITATFVGYQIAGILGACVGTLGIFLPSLFVVVLVEPWYRRFRNSPVVQGVTRGLALSFVGLLASVTIHFARAVPWSLPAVVIAGGGLVALLRKVDVLWVVLAGAAISAIVL
jgi:chromate transporter